MSKNTVMKKKHTNAAYAESSHRRPASHKSPARKYDEDYEETPSRPKKKNSMKAKKKKNEIHFIV